MNTLKKTAWTAIAAAAVNLAAPIEDAHAAKIPIVYQSGQDVFVAGDGSLPAPYDKDEALNGMQAGYMCDIFGLMGAYFTISDCKPVAFKGDTFVDDAELVKAIAAAHPEDSMEVGIWRKHGRIPLGFVILGLLGFAAWSQLSGDDDDEEEAVAG